MFKIGVFALIFNDQQEILLCHRTDYDLWNMPGGGLEDGEAPWDGVKREVLEETGLVVEVKSLQGVYKKGNKDEIVFSFVCSPLSGEFRLNNEASDIRFFGVNELPENFSENQRQRIFDYLNDPEGLTMRTQEGPSSIEKLQSLK